jgi:hypothetical protein
LDCCGAAKKKNKLSREDLAFFLSSEKMRDTFCSDCSRKHARKEGQRGFCDNNLLSVNLYYDSTAGEVVNSFNILQRSAFKAAKRCGERFGTGKTTWNPYSAKLGSEAVERRDAMNSAG